MVSPGGYVDKRQPVTLRCTMNATALIPANGNGCDLNIRSNEPTNVTLTLRKGHQYGRMCTQSDCTSQKIRKTSL